MLRLNVSVADDLFHEVEEYAKRYRINRASAVSCLLSYALEKMTPDRKPFITNRSNYPNRSG